MVTDVLRMLCSGKMHAVAQHKQYAMGHDLQLAVILLHVIFTSARHVSPSLMSLLSTHAPCTLSWRKHAHLQPTPESIPAFLALRAMPPISLVCCCSSNRNKAARRPIPSARPSNQLQPRPHTEYPQPACQGQSRAGRAPALITPTPSQVLNANHQAAQAPQRAQRHHQQQAQSVSDTFSRCPPAPSAAASPAGPPAPPSSSSFSRLDCGGAGGACG